MKTQLLKITDIKPNSKNPRIIKDEKFKKLVKSIKEFPKMLEIRPIVVDKDNVVLAGNMRLKACKEAGLVEVPVISAEHLTPEEQHEFIVKDNLSYGEWEWEALTEDWAEDELLDWGVDMPYWNDDMTNNNDYEGLDQLSKLDKFMNAEIKRMFLVYDNETFTRVIEWFNRLQKKFDVEDNNQVILKLMEDENI